MIAKNENKKTSPIKNHLTPLTIFMLVVLCFYSLVLLGLLFWAFICCFKNAETFIYGNTYKFPDVWYWNLPYVAKAFKYKYVSSQGTQVVGMGQMYLNSILYSFGCAFTSTTSACLVAYMCARYKYKFSTIIYNVVIVAMIIPVIGSLPSEIQMSQRFGLYGHIWGMWLMRANFLGMYFLVFFSAFKSLPITYTEAGKIDGAGNFAIMIKICLPLILNLYATVFLINFITFWNDYQVPHIYLREKPTIADGVFNIMHYSSANMDPIPYKMVASCMVMLPILLVFLAVHKRLMGNLTVGGIKG